MSVLASLYGGYIASANGKAPPDEATFKDYIRKHGKAALDAQGIGVDDLFVSLRDQEPLVVLYGDSGRKASANQIVAHEKTGRGGKRYVAFTTGSVVEVASDAFAKLNL